MAPISDDIEPVGESRADVVTGNEEEEESSEAEIPTVEMNPMNPTSREKQEHEDSGGGVLLVLKVVALGDNIKLNRWRKKENKQPQC